MKIVVFGAGHIGLITSLCFAEAGHDVLCIDVNHSKILLLQDGIAPFYEPGLTELLKEQLLMGRVQFSTDPKLAIPSPVSWPKKNFPMKKTL